MKKFSQIFEHCVTADVNPGNSGALGVTNHLTPVNNIVTMVRNMFGSQLSIVVAVAEDGVSLKLHSSRFINKEEINKVLNQYVYHNLNVKDYIMSQGLDFIKLVSLGGYWVVYFSPSDIKTAAPGLEPVPCEEQLAFGLVESEMDTLLNEGSSEDEELEDLTKKKIHVLITNKDKVKSAKQLGILIANEIELPREYYFAGVKAANGDESIALRWKYTKRAGKNASTEITKTLINIYGEGKDAIFVPDFDEKSYFQLPEEVKKLIENIIEFLGGEKTDDKCIFKIEETESKDDDKKDDEKTDDSKSEESSDSKDKNNDKSGDLLGGASDDDSEDDKSRGGSDDLLG